MKKEEFKITLISPYLDVRVFGIRILSSCLKKEGYSPQILFVPNHFTVKYDNETLSEIVKMVEVSSLVGITLSTNYFSNVIQITKILKKDLNAPIIWGGAHPTIRPAECLNYADIVCVGEGEKSLIELVNKMRTKEKFTNIQGMWFKNKKTIIKNENRPLIQDLDSLPFQDYESENHYLILNGKTYKMDDSLLKHYMRQTYDTIGTRGCPFGCNFCHNNALNKMYPNQNIIRKRSSENIIKEFENIKNKFSFIKTFQLADDTFLLRTDEEIKDFCEKYKESIGMPLIICGMHPAVVTKEKISYLIDAGLVKVRMGIQTASENTKKIYNRCYSNSKVEEAAKTFNKFKNKIGKPAYDIILDNPWESDKDLIDTLMFLSKLPKPYRLHIFSLTFYPGTVLYWKAKKDGIIKNELEDVYSKYYHGCKKTYLNNLFFLLNDYEGRIHPKIVSLLTNQKLRELKLSWLLYATLKTAAVPLSIFFRRERVKYLLHEMVKEVERKNYDRITRYVKTEILHKSF